MQKRKATERCAQRDNPELSSDVLITLNTRRYGRNVHKTAMRENFVIHFIIPCKFLLVYKVKRKEF